METKNCQNCKKDFVIEEDDFSFYEKIKVPPPTFCPECRSVRRMVSTNERVLYKRKCDFTGEQIFSMYPEGTTFPVYETSAWYGDGWDPYQYGIDIDFSRPFLEQILELQNKVPRMSLVRQGMSANSPYAHRVSNPKNSYMVFRSIEPDNCLYTYFLFGGVNCCDCMFTVDCELCYECIGCEKCYNVKFSEESKECRDSSFLYACKNCSNCVGCVNLVNQEYCLWNVKYSKEEYFEKLKELKLNTQSGLKEMKEKFDIFRKKFPERAISSLKSQEVSGNWFSNSKNVKESFFCTNVKDGKYLFAIIDAEDCMDYYSWGAGAELVYESVNCGMNCSRIFFSTQCWTSAHDLYYCDTCPSSGNCFGCVGLKKGEYSILNKKYSKEEYEALVPKIIEHMKAIPYVDKKGVEYKFGEHFPDELSAFAYNETAAIDYYPLTKKEALSKGYKWKDKEKKNYSITKEGIDLPETIAEVDDSILKEVISCEDKDKEYSTGAYRITEAELSFYRRMDIPLPRAFFDVRHTRRLQKRPSLKTLDRHCSKCDTEVKTVYTADRSPILYCEKCYQQEVY